MPAPTEKKSNYAPEALARVLSQFRNKTFFDALVSVFAGELQRIEDANWEVVQYRLFDQAEGVQLDTIGRIVGVFRGDLTLDAFKREIQVAILLLTSQGDPNTVEKVADLSLPDTATYHYRERTIATIWIYVYGPISETDARQAFRLLNRARQGGVRLIFDYPNPTGPLNRIFTLRDDYHLGSTTDPTKGLSDDYVGLPLNGGYLREAFST